MTLLSFSDSFLSAIKQTSFSEWLVFITALAYVFFAIIENVWCWLFGIISCALSVYLCYTGKLFLESGLQVFYVIISFYGWYQWLHGSIEKKELRIVSYSFRKNLVIILTGIAIWIPLGIIFSNYSTQVLPFLDAFVTAFSLLATWMTTKKIIENWLYWILIDLFAISLYFNRGFYLIALIYFIYTFLAIAGYFKWKKNCNAY